MAKLLDLYIKEELIAQCTEHFKKFLAEQGSGYLTDEDFELIGTQVDYIFELMDEIIKEFRDNGEDEIEAYAKIIDQLSGYLILGKMNEARLCNILIDMTDGKDKK